MTFHMCAFYTTYTWLDACLHYQRLYKCRLTCGRVQITFIHTGERESIHLFIVCTAVSVHAQTTVFFVAITVFKTIQARLRKVAVDSFLFKNTYPLLMSKSNLFSSSRTPLTVYLSVMLKFFLTYAFCAFALSNWHHRMF